MRVIHFVTGGFSGGATQVALSLVRATQHEPGVESILVLRKKSHMPKQRVEALRQEGIRVYVVNNWLHLTTVFALVRLCHQLEPDVFVAHGFSEHLWGRLAAYLAGVPHIVQVEHNTRERYTRFRYWLSRKLNAVTDAIVGCSEGVRQVLLKRGYDADKCIAISNGIKPDAFSELPSPASERAGDVIMVARIAKQKDHRTLIASVGILQQRGVRVKLQLIGKGKARVVEPLKQQVQALGLDAQIDFAGYRSDVPELLKNTRIFVQCTHYEGMPLTLIEAMAAGCAVIGSQVPGVQEVIAEECNGLTHRHQDAEHLADQIERLLSDDAFCNQLGAKARQDALSQYTQTHMSQQYLALFKRLQQGSSR